MGTLNASSFSKISGKKHFSASAINSFEANLISVTVFILLRWEFSQKNFFNAFYNDDLSIIGNNAGRISLRGI